MPQSYRNFRSVCHGLGGRANVVTGGPIDLGGFSEPQSDLMLLKRRDDFYRGKTPEAVDALLVVEVSDSSLNFDLGKNSAYTRGTALPSTGLLMWHQSACLCSAAQIKNAMRTLPEMRGANLLVPLAFPELSIAVRDLFD